MTRPYLPAEICVFSEARTEQRAAVEGKEGRILTDADPVVHALFEESRGQSSVDFRAQNLPSQFLPLLRQLLHKVFVCTPSQDEFVLSWKEGRVGRDGSCFALLLSFPHISCGFALFKQRKETTERERSLSNATLSPLCPLRGQPRPRRRKHAARHVSSFLLYDSVSGRRLLNSR